VNCQDGNPCDTWFTAEGRLVCRHGLAEETFTNTTYLKFVCPLKIQQKHVDEQWTIFWEKKDEIIRKFLNHVSVNVES